MKTQPDIDDADERIGHNVHVLLFEDDRSADTELVNGSSSRPRGKRTDFGSPGVAQNYPGRVSSDANIRETSSRPVPHNNGGNSSPLNGSSRDVSPNQLTAARERFEIGKHFDVEYYASEYPDIALDPSQLLGHFCEIGWREGRNPNAFFDTVSYLLHNTDVARSKINPYYHYLKHGLIEGRIVSSSISPSIRSRLLFGEFVCDWVKRLRAHVDEDFYGQPVRERGCRRTRSGGALCLSRVARGQIAKPGF